MPPANAATRIPSESRLRQNLTGSALFGGQLGAAAAPLVPPARAHRHPVRSGKCQPVWYGIRVGQYSLVNENQGQRPVGAYILTQTRSQGPGVEGARNGGTVGVELGYSVLFSSLEELAKCSPLPAHAPDGINVQQAKSFSPIIMETAPPSHPPRGSGRHDLKYHPMYHFRVIMPRKVR